MSVAVALMMRLEVLPVTVPDGDNSSPSVPEGTVISSISGVEINSHDVMWSVISEQKCFQMPFKLSTAE